MANIKLRGLDQTTNQIRNATATDVIVGGTGTIEVDLVSTGNITLSGEQSIDGITTSASTVLCVGQSINEDNGIYLTSAGAWVRTIITEPEHLLEMAINRKEVMISNNAFAGNHLSSYALIGNSAGDQIRFYLTQDPFPINPASLLALGQMEQVWKITPGIYTLYSRTLTAPTAQINIPRIPIIANATLCVQFSGISTYAGGSDLVMCTLGTSSTLDTTLANYYVRNLFGYAATSTNVAVVAANVLGAIPGTGTVEPGIISARLENYSSTTFYKNIITRNNYQSVASGYPIYAGGIYDTQWKNAGAVNILRLHCNAGNMDTGSIVKVFLEVI